jgi:hypothetical protein
MKIIDKTPFLNENGELRGRQRIQGMLKYGFNWPVELEAQKAIITFFDRKLEKGYTLIRNMTLGASGIVVPIILLGPTGIHVIHVTYLRGRYEVRANSWNEESGNDYKPASVNLVQETIRMAHAVKAFIERQGVKLPIEIEPVLIAANPGLHVESVRPAIKVIMIDGVKSYVSGLAASGPVLKPEAVHEFTERIVNPRSPRKSTPAMSAPEQLASDAVPTQPPPQEGEFSRARTIFNASEEAKPFNPADFDFAMGDEETALETLTPPASTVEPSPAQPLPVPTPQRRRFLGMTPLQAVFVAVLAGALLCLLVVFAILIFFGPTLVLP